MDMNTYTLISYDARGHWYRSALLAEPSFQWGHSRLTFLVFAFAYRFSTPHLSFYGLPPSTNRLIVGRIADPLQPVAVTLQPVAVRVKLGNVDHVVIETSEMPEPDLSLMLNLVYPGGHARCRPS